MSKKLLVLSAVLTFFIVTLQVRAESDSNLYGDPYLIRCTCYTASEGAITASGQPVREGIVSAKTEWRGYAIVIYENNNGEVGDLIGIYEVLDTGGAKSIKSGKSIDVFRDTLERCYDWVGEYGDYVFIQVIPAKG